METGDSLSVLGQSSACSILSALNFNPWLFRPPNGDWELQFVVYQFFQLYQELSTDESFNVSSLNMRNLMLSESLWISLMEENHKKVFDNITPIEEKEEEADDNADKFSPEGLFTPPSYDIILHLTSKSYQSVCIDWLFGRLSNFEYILYLNYMAGRSWNDPNYYPIMPWVTDFSVQSGGFVDLTKTKFRQTKGDAALDSTFTLISSGATPPHHVPSLLTDLTYYLYKARRLDKELLCRHVRKRWVPSEYPSSMKRMQEWSPEECIPDFYCDPVIFKSIHEDLMDIAYPLWCNSPKDFIRYHREMLESPEVSASLHCWIDLTFGSKLSGADAVTEKNVHLYLVDTAGRVSHRSGVVQLFSSPHPPRFQSVASSRCDILKNNPTALLDFTEKLSSFLVDSAFLSNNSVDETLDKYLEKFLESSWDFPETEQLLTAIAVLIVEVSLFHTASVEIAAANGVPDANESFSARLKLATSLYRRHCDDVDSFLTIFKPFLNDIFFDSKSDLSDDSLATSRLDLHRLELGSAISTVLAHAIYFPSYFPRLYDCLFDVHSLHKQDASPVELVKIVMKFFTDPVEIPYTITASFYKVFSDLFNWADTQALVILCLLPHFGFVLGRENCIKFLSKPLKEVLQGITEPSTVTVVQKQHCLKFFHRDFETKLISFFGLQTFLEIVVPCLVRATVFKIDGVEPSTLNWVIDYVGPIHAARSVTPLLFANLSTCYDQIPDSLSEQPAPCHECPFPSLHCLGDSRVDQLGDILCNAACSYGELMITGHYVSCIADVIQQAFTSQGSLTEQVESSLLGVLYVLRQLIFVMPSTLLSSQVQERLSRLLTQVVTQLTSLHIAFPRAPRSRHLALCRYLDVVYAIGLRLGRLNTEQLLEPLLRLTLIKLSVTLRTSMPSDSGDDVPLTTNEIDLEQRLPTDSLYLAYSVFSRIVSKPFLESITSMNLHFQGTALNDIPDLCSSSSRDRQLFSLGSSLSAGSNRLQQDSLLSLGNRQNFISHENSGILGEVDQSYRLWERKTRHLSNQWAALWAQRLAAPRDFSLKGLHLQSFAGQGPQTKGSVQHLMVSSSNEQIALSISSGSSRERAVAIWSLESRSDHSGPSAPILLYPEHKRRVLGLTLLDAHRQVASIDSSSLHLWDFAVGRPVSVVTSSAAIATLPPSTYISSYSSPTFSSVSALGDCPQLALVSTSFGLIFIIDPRLPTAIANAIRSPPLPSGSMSLLASNSDASLFATGSTSSYVSIVCPRTGRLVGATRVYESSDLAKMTFYGRNNLLTANQDRVLSLFAVNDSAASLSVLPLSFEPALNENFSSVVSLVGHFRASLSDSPVSIMPGPQSPVIVVATSDRLQYYSNGLDPRSACQDFPLSRLDSLRSKSITAATVIPSSGLLLLGTDSGTLHMIA